MSTLSAGGAWGFYVADARQWHSLHRFFILLRPAIYLSDSTIPKMMKRTLSRRRFHSDMPCEVVVLITCNTGCAIATRISSRLGPAS